MDPMTDPETILTALGCVIIISLVIYMLVRWTAYREAEQETRMREAEARLHPNRLVIPAAAPTHHMQHATRHRVHRYPNGGYCIDGVDMDLGLDLGDLIVMGILSQQDVEDYNTKASIDDMLAGPDSSDSRPLPVMGPPIGAFVPEEFFHVTPVETPSSAPDWGDSRSEPSHYEAPSSYESSSYDSGSSSSSSSDCGSSSGGGDW